MSKSSFRTAPKGAYVAAVAQVAAIVFGALGFAGPPPVEAASVVTFTTAQAYWITAMWLVSLIGMTQTFFALTRKRQDAEDERDKIRAELNKKRENQALSDLLSDQWDFGIHELLNKPPIPDSEQSFAQWSDSVHKWTQKTLERMHQHDCTKQDVRRVNTLGVFPTLVGIHKNPGVAHEMSMLVERLNRIGEVAQKYGD